MTPFRPRSGPEVQYSWPGVSPRISAGRAVGGTLSGGPAKLEMPAAGPPTAQRIERLRSRRRYSMPASIAGGCVGGPVTPAAMPPALARGKSLRRTHVWRTLDLAVSVEPDRAQRQLHQSILGQAGHIQPKEAQGGPYLVHGGRSQQRPEPR